MKAFEIEPEFRKTTLENGVRVLTEHHPYTRATCAGIYACLGTRDEPEDLEGAAHFLEHIVFKGTKKRSAYDIAKELEAVGGELNAFTSRETTCYHATSLKEDLSMSLDVLLDIVSQAQFSKEDVEKEREVILQEIDMSMDLLEDYIFDLYFEWAYKGHNLGRNILGTEKSLEGISRKKLMDFYKNRYAGENLIVSVAGDVDHDQVVEQVQKVLKGKLKSNLKNKRRKPQQRSFREIIKKSSEQVHLLVGLPSSSFREKHRFEAYIVNSLLGGGMTSRLYQKVREKRGLAYSVYSYLHSFTDSGLLMIYAGTSEKNLKKVTDIVYKEMKSLKEKGVSKSQLKQFKKQVEGGILLGADDIENRMNSIAVNEMVFGKYRSVDSVVAEIEEISLDSIREYLDKYFDFNKIGALVIGDVDESKTKELLDSLE